MAHNTEIFRARNAFATAANNRDHCLTDHSMVAADTISRGQADMAEHKQAPSLRPALMDRAAAKLAAATECCPQ